MRAHEKMLLNSTLMTAQPFIRHYGRGVGCALGMIEGPNLETVVMGEANSAEGLYPWLKEEVAPPCDCGMVFGPTWPTWTGIIAIAHLFNEHVFAGELPEFFGITYSGSRAFPNAEPWTMEQLADYIKSIDPTIDQDEELICETEAVHEYQEV